MENTTYSVIYELECQPTNVIVELKCKDKLEARDLYEKRCTNSIYKNLIIKEYKI